MVGPSKPKISEFGPVTIAVPFVLAERISPKKREDIERSDVLPLLNFIINAQRVQSGSASGSGGRCEVREEEEGPGYRGYDTAHETQDILAQISRIKILVPSLRNAPKTMTEA